MVAAVTRAAGIIDRVSSLYRRGTPERELVDLNEIVREMSVLLGDTANRNAISIRTELDPGLPRDDSGSRTAAAGFDEPHAQRHRGDARDGW